MTMMYDGILLIAVLFFASFALLPFPSIQHGQSLYFLQYIYLALVSFLYFGWSWKHGGQTLGLKTWKLQLVGLNGTPVTWKQAAVRYLGSLFCWASLGLGFVWILFHRDRLAWNDILSNTKIVHKNSGTTSI